MELRIFRVVLKVEHTNILKDFWIYVIYTNGRYNL